MVGNNNHLFKLTVKKFVLKLEGKTLENYSVNVCMIDIFITYPDI